MILTYFMNRDPILPVEPDSLFMVIGIWFYQTNGAPNWLRERLPSLKKIMSSVGGWFTNPNPSWKTYAQFVKMGWDWSSPKVRGSKSKQIFELPPATRSRGLLLSDCKTFRFTNQDFMPWDRSFFSQTPRSDNLTPGWTMVVHQVVEWNKATLVL